MFVTYRTDIFLLCLFPNMPLTLVLSLDGCIRAFALARQCLAVLMLWPFAQTPVYQWAAKIG